MARVYFGSARKWWQSLSRS